MNLPVTKWEVQDEKLMVNYVYLSVRPSSWKEIRLNLGLGA